MLVFTQPATAATIQPGQTITNAIAFSSEMDTYSFSGTTGDTVTVRMSTSSGNLDPDVEVQAPNGTVLTNAWSSSSVTTQIKIAQSGTYLLVCRDHYGTYTGSYGVSLIKNPGPNLPDPDGGTIQPGETKTGTITVSDLDVFEFVAGTGDTVTVRMSTSSGNLDPEVEVQAPNGTVLTNAWSSSSVTAQIKIAQSGTYLLVCRDHYGTYTGAYSLSFICVGGCGQSYPPTNVLAHPPQQAVCVGATAAFNVTATGSGLLSYQWRRNGEDLADDGRISGAATASLTITNVQPRDGGDYTVVVSNAAGSATSSPASLTVHTAPSITQQPQNQFANIGSTVTFSFKAVGTEPLTYFWRFNEAPLLEGAQFSGVTNDTLTIANVQTGNVGAYDVVVTNSCGSVTSSLATLTVRGRAPFITEQPQDVTTYVGAQADLCVAADGSFPLTFQWRLNGIVLTNLNNSSLQEGIWRECRGWSPDYVGGTFRLDPEAETSEYIGHYDVVVTNAWGSVTSRVAG